MSAPIAKDQFVFELPNLTYVDAHLEEANLRLPLPAEKPRGLRGLIVGFRAWRERQARKPTISALRPRGFSAGSGSRRLASSRWAST